MPNKGYQKGRRFEYASKKVWKERGCEVVRAAGSHSPFDLIAIRPGGQVSLIQCKCVRSEAQAERLLKLFRATPPLMVSAHYHQVLEVKVQRQGVRSTTV